VPKIADKVVVAQKLTEAMSAIASYRGRKIVDVEQDLVFELSQGNLAARTLKSWKNPNSIPDNIDDGVFFGIVYLCLKTERLGLDWLINLLDATTVPVYKPLSPKLMRAYLKQAQILGSHLSDEDLEDVLTIFFDEDNHRLHGVEFIYKTGFVGGEVLQPLIPLEPINSKFIRGANQIRISGLSLFRMIETFFYDFVYAASNGATIRAILASPVDPLLDMIVLRSLSQRSREEQKQLILSTIDTLLRINQVSQTGAVQIRTLDYMPPYGITAYESHNTNQSLCHIRLYPFRMPTSEAPVLLTTPKSYTQWHEFFSNQFDLMWDSAQTWEPS